MKNIKSYSQDRLMMIYTNVKVAQSLRNEIATYDNTDLEAHYKLERNFSKVVNFLEMELSEQHQQMNIYKRYELLADAFGQVIELAATK